LVLIPTELPAVNPIPFMGNSLLCNTPVTLAA